jgi:hypothetical protein
MTINNLNIIKDCWWLNVSGNSYITNENDLLSSLTLGLHDSLNSNDNQYLKLCGSGKIKYYGRLETNNVNVDDVYVSVRASGDDVVNSRFYINNEITPLILFDPWSGLETQNKHKTLTNTDKKLINSGRINANYDFFCVEFDIPDGLDHVSKLYNIEVSYSGNSTWDNHDIAPTIDTITFKPKQISLKNNCNYQTNDNTDIYSSGVSYLQNVSDNNYIEQISGPEYSKALFVNTSQSLFPNGGISLFFDMAPSGLDVLTQIQRAQIKLRMSLPPSGLYNNIQDTFEINGYNEQFKNQDYSYEMQESLGSNKLKESKYGYFFYGVGETVQQSGFKNYVVELNFLDPQDSILVSTKYKNIDCINNTEFQLIGLPSGVQISHAELLISYIPNNFCSLYTIGNTRRTNICSDIDSGTIKSSFFGHGGWHHRGNFDECQIFDAFFNFSESSGHYTYSNAVCNQSGCYGEYVNYLPHDPNEIITTIEPQRKNYYRNPLRVDLSAFAFGSNMSVNYYQNTLSDIYSPTFYRNLIYNGSPFLEFDVQNPSASLYSPNIAQVYFDDRIDIGTDFTIYMLLYREMTNDGQAYGRILQRGESGLIGETNYEFICSLETEKIRLNIKDNYDVTHTLSLNLPYYTIEPILIWISSNYNAFENETTIQLNVHTDIRSFLYKDWLFNSVTFYGGRKRYNESKTVLGSLYLPYDAYGNISANSALSFVSFGEFGWANRFINLDYLTSTPNVSAYYDISTDESKTFFASRVSNSNYLNGDDGVLWNVVNGSGTAEWQTKYSLNSILHDPRLHSIYNPVTIAGGNYWVHPSAIYVILDIENDTNHPSGIYIDCDVEFDSSSIDNWKVSRHEFNFPSGSHIGTAQISKHIGMYDLPILYDDIDDIAINIKTKYVDINNQKYYGNLKLNSINVCFDSFLQPVQIDDVVLLETLGGPTFFENSIDLVTHGFISINNDCDLYIYGIPHVASGNVDLYTKADFDILPPYYDPHVTEMLLFVEGLTPGEINNSLEFFTTATSGCVGIYKNTPLYICGIGRDQQLPLFIKAPIGKETTYVPLYLESHFDSMNNIVDLYTIGPSGVNDELDLYINGLGTTDGALPTNVQMPLFIARDTESVMNTTTLFLAQNDVVQNTDLFVQGVGIAHSSVPMYIYGSGVFYDSINLYSHGF